MSCAALFGIYTLGSFIGMCTYKAAVATDISPDKMVAVEIPEGGTCAAEYYLKSDIERVKKIANKDHLTAISEINTPKDASIYCTEVLKHDNTSWSSFERIHENKRGDCVEATTAAAVFIKR